MARISTALSNPIRTGVQGGVAYAIAEFLDSFGILEMDDRQFLAFVAVALLVVGFIQNAVENGIGKGFMRTPRSTAPVVGEKPAGG